MLILFSFLIGHMAVHFLDTLPSPTSIMISLILTLMVMMAGWFLRRYRYIVGALGVCALSFMLTAYRAHERLVIMNLPSESATHVLTRFRVDSMVQFGDQKQARFIAHLSDSQPLAPDQVQLVWGQAPSDISPGQWYQGKLTLKPIHALSNPYGFDFESYLFANGIRAQGQIQGQAQFLRVEHSLFTRLEAIRQYIRLNMAELLPDHAYTPVLIALVIGDQAGVSSSQWEIFNQAGITHLVSISGLHVTMVAALGGLFAGQVWRRFSWRGLPLAERTPAQTVGMLFAIVFAFFYCLLAGWGVPAQRTFFMLFVYAMCRMLRLPMSFPLIVLVSACLIVLLDPWAILSRGFLLSFGAICLLAMCGYGQWTRPQKNRLKRYGLGLVQSARIQWVMSFGLAPLLITMFQSVSLISPVINAFAIPIVSFLVTPLALVSSVLSLFVYTKSVAFYGLSLAHWLFELMMHAIHFLLALPYTLVTFNVAPWYWVILALLGILMTLLPKGFPAKSLGVICVLPLLLYRPVLPDHGGWHMTVLDVGQGGATLIQTRSHTLLYDAGPVSFNGNDAAYRVILPFLHGHGIKKIDTLMVSHEDLDHAGGLSTIMDTRMIGSLIVPEPMFSSAGVQTYQDSTPLERCQAGKRWEWDGVVFEIIHPAQSYVAKTSNASSCVLSIRGRWHSGLLTGDIGVLEEDALSLEVYDVVHAPHHGSNTSSGLSLVRRTQAKHVIMQLGFLNRYHHPHASVLRRWTDYEATIHRTDWHGAILIDSSGQGLDVAHQRARHRRYWHWRCETDQRCQ